MSFLKSKWISATILGAFVVSAVFCCCWTKDVQAAGHPASCHSQPAGKTPSAPEKSPYSCKVVGLSAGDLHFEFSKISSPVIFLLSSAIVSPVHSSMTTLLPFFNSGGVDQAGSPPIYILHSVFRI